EHLDGAVDDVVQHPGTEELDERDFLARSTSALGIDLPRRVQRHQPRSLDVGTALRNPVLDVRLTPERAAERFALGGIATHHLERTLGHTQPPHAVVDPPRAEPFLSDHESHPLWTA